MNRLRGIKISDLSYEQINSIFKNLELDTAIDVLTDLIVSKKFNNNLKLFREGMKLEIAEAIKKIVNR